MKIKKTKIKDLLVIKLDKFNDSRGSLTKVLNKKYSKKFNNNCYESYISISKKGSVRGLHGQSGKYSQEKIIYCLNGKLIDVAIDIRKKSKTFGKIYTKILQENDAFALFIPKGFLHGFIALKDKTILVNYCNSPYNSKKEIGIKLNTIPANLPKVKLFLSKKDKLLPSYQDFINKK